MLGKDYWDERYLSGQTGWDIGYVSPPLQAYFDTLTDPNLRILIPGGGNSYEADYLLAKGFQNITVVDISEVVCRRLTEKYDGQGVNVVCEDFFQHIGTYDLIVEQTFFCALNPELRPAYLQKMRELLAHTGKLAGLLFNRDFVGGPPFGGSESEYRILFQEADFEVIIDLTPASIPPRRESELFFIAAKR
ncbi:MAG: methyltransferase domain-containing protein [Spirosomataceae bacterium]